MSPRRLKKVRFAAVLQVLGFAEGRSRDEDIEQAIVRVAITGLVLCYALYLALTESPVSPGLKLALAIAFLGFSGGCAIWWWLRTHPARKAPMRLVGIAADMGLLTVGAWAGAEHAVPLIGVYLWVTVGNGFRYGPRYLIISYWASLACFGALLWQGPFWREHRDIGVGFMVVLALIPLYVLVLLSRLTAQKEAAVQLSNAKSRFVANVSHELRTPLAGIFAVYDLMRMSRTHGNQDLVKSLGSAIASLKVSVDAILQMSKLEAGAERVELRVFNIREFLRRLSSLAQPQATAKSLLWRLEVDDQIPTLVVGDAGHLQHVLGNLINNAIKFTTDGSVRLHLQVVRTGVLRFEITDTGIGIAKDQQERLFERFVQADGSSTRRFGGTGLGTSIAHDLVKLMGGSIGVSSELGRGSTFWVELPLPRAYAAAPRSDWVGQRHVWIIGVDAAATRSLSGQLRTKSIESKLFSVNDPLPTTGTMPFAALMLLPPAEALACGRKLTLPWVVLESHVTLHDNRYLCEAGAAAVLSPSTELETIYLHLCALVGLPEMLAPDQVLPLKSRPLRVLLADDNLSNSLLLKRILEGAGHSVILAKGGNEAFDLMVSGKPDLAILDLNMPEMAGPDIVKLYRAGETGSLAHMPIIILSADATPDAKEDSLSAGADEFLSKPVSASDLLAALARYSRLDEPDKVEVSENAPDGRMEVAANDSAVASATPAAALRAINAQRTLVDGERLNALREIANDDRGFVQQYASAAFEDLDLAIGELRSALLHEDERAARDALHKIDGTAASIGAGALIQASKSFRGDYLGTWRRSANCEAALLDLNKLCALSRQAFAIEITQTPSKPASR